MQIDGMKRRAQSTPNIPERLYALTFLQVISRSDDFSSCFGAWGHVMQSISIDSLSAFSQVYILTVAVLSRLAPSVYP